MNSQTCRSPQTRHFSGGLGRLAGRYRATAVLLAMLAASFLGLSASHARWQDELGTLRVGLAGAGSPARIAASAEPFRLALQDQLGVAIEIRGYASLRDLVLAHAEGRVEYAIYTATAYAAAWHECECIEPLAIASGSDGSQSVRSLLIARASHTPNTLAGLDGSAIVALGPDSVLGYAFPVFELARLGHIADAGAQDYRFFPTAEEAIAAFAQGEGDYLLGWTTGIGDVSSGYTRGTLKRLVEISGSIGAFPVIWESEPVPHRVHAVRSNLDGEAKSLLREVLSRMNEADPVAYDSIEPVYGGGFVIARQSMFAPLESFIAAPVPGSDPAPADRPVVPPGDETGDGGETTGPVSTDGMATGG